MSYALAELCGLLVRDAYALALIVLELNTLTMILVTMVVIA